MVGRLARVIGLAAKLLLRALWISTMVLVPLFGFWLASSVAAYLNATQWIALGVGLLLFPGLPIGWDLVYAWRRSKRPASRSVLTGIDRLVLRTLLVSGAFLGIMFAWQPRTAFRSLAVRGDWVLDGRHGPTATRVRSVLLGLADTLEMRWHAHTHDYGTSDTAPAPTGVTPAPVVLEPAGDAWPMPAAVDVQVTSIPADVQTSPEAVGRYLGERIGDPRRRAKAVHDYIALRLAYDYDAFARITAKDYDHVASQDAEPVFAARRGVCEGYARLFVSIGKAAGLEVAYITGFARDSQQQPPPDGSERAAVIQSLEGYGHAWNAVKLDGAWNLVDVTWDDPKDSKDPLETTYLLTPAAAFGYQHFPDDAAWQLVAAPITPGDFVRQPLLTPTIYALGVTLESPTRSQVTVGGDELVLEVANPHGATLAADVRDPADQDGAGGTRCTIEDSTGHARFTCPVPSGQHAVLLFGGAGGAASTKLDYLGTVLVNRR